MFVIFANTTVGFAKTHCQKISPSANTTVIFAFFRVSAIDNVDFNFF
jgi:hypothetical protein